MNNNDTWSNGKPKTASVPIRIRSTSVRLLSSRQVEPLTCNPSFKPEAIPEPRRTNPVNLADLLEWHLAVDYVGNSSRSVLRARQNLEYFILFLNGRPFVKDKIGSVDLYAQWIAYAASRWAPRTVRMVTLRVTDRLCSFLVKREYMLNNPAAICRKPKFKTPPTRPPFTAEEYERMVKAAEGTEYQWLLLCGYNTGMSIADCCLLQKSEVDFDTLFINKDRQKNGNRCSIPIKAGGEFHEALKKLVAESEKYQFYPNDPKTGRYYLHPELAMKGLRPTSADILRVLSKIFARAGIDKRKTFHNFRATMCSDLANSGVSTPLACSITGHKSPDIFKHYVTPDNHGLRRTYSQAMEHRAMKAAEAASLRERKEQGANVA